VTEITLKNDLKQKSPKQVSAHLRNFASWIAFLWSNLKIFINILATFQLVRPILTPLVWFLSRTSDPTLRAPVTVC